jgi:hypothetical protein
MNDDPIPGWYNPFEGEPMSMSAIFSDVCYMIKLTKDKWQIPKARKFNTNHGALEYADIVMLLYDVWARLTFDVLPEICEWIGRIRTTMPQFVVIATNTEIPRATWDVSFEEGKAYADRLGASFGTYSRDEAMEAVRPAVEAVVAARNKAEMEEHNHNELPNERRSRRNSSGDNRNLMQRVWQKFGFRRAH